MADDRGMPGHTGEEMALRMAKNTETPEGSAPTPKQREEREAHREICSLCHEVSRVGFHVPNDIWGKALHASQIHDIICLACFTRLADERGVVWDGDITFYPVSRASHDSLHTPSPKQREEREDVAVVREELELHKGDILADFVARRRGPERVEDADRRARRILSRLRTHSPEEPVGEEGPFPANRAAGSWLHRALYRSGFGILSVRQSVDVLHLANRMSREYPEDGQPDPVGQAFGGEGES